MAKKSVSKKSKAKSAPAAKKPAAKVVKKAASKPAKSKPVAKKAKSAKPQAANSTAPRPVSTGKGLQPVDIGRQVVADFNEGKMDMNDALWSKDIVSIEGLGMGLAWHGRAAADEKSAHWMAAHKVHGASAEGPYVGSTGFAIKFTMDVEEIASGKRINMVEVGTYTVSNGKIVTEEFMYKV
jgi:hypothetical protein